MQERKIESLLEYLYEIQTHLKSQEEEYRCKIIDVNLILMQKNEKINISNSVRSNALHQGNKGISLRTQTASANSVKLPKITIPHCDGS